MASYNVRLFKNTGFNLENIPDRASLLNDISINKVDVDAIWVYQNQELGRIRVKTDFTNIYSVDYCRIGTTGNNQTFTYYFVTNITMINPVTAELDLQIDAITTIGLTNITNNILDGWCTRRCVTDDTLFNNCIDEDFTPTQPLEHDTQEIEVPSTGVLFVVSTIDLAKVSQLLSQGYKNSAESTEVNVSVPTVPAIGFDYTTITIDYQGLKLSRELVGKRMYAAMGEQGSIVPALIKALTTVWSLGLTDAIAGIYYLPIGQQGTGHFTYNATYHVEETTDGNMIVIDELTVYGGANQLNNIPFKWNTSNIHNNKVFATRYNNYRLISMVSGNEASYFAGDIYDKLNNPSAPTIAINIDGSDNGTTYARPEYIKGVDLSQSSKPFEIMRDSVTGGDWVSANVNMIRPKGITKSLTELNLNEAVGTLGSIGSGLSALAGMNVNTTNLSTGYREQYIRAVNLAKSQPLADEYVTQGSTVTMLQGDYSGSKLSIPAISNIGNFVSSLFNSRVNKARRNIAKANAIIQTPQTWFPIDNTLSLFYGNSYYVVRERLSDADTLKLDKYLTMYGYAVNEPITKDCFYGRQYFNYIECEGLNLGKLNVGTETGNTQECPLRLKQAAIAMLQNGIRIWHTQVTQDAFNNNPIVGG